MLHYPIPTQVKVVSHLYFFLFCLIYTRVRARVRVAVQCAVCGVRRGCAQQHVRKAGGTVKLRLSVLTSLNISELASAA